MKLNLLPTTVSKGASLRGAVALSVIIALAAAIGAFVMVQTGNSDLTSAKDKAAAWDVPAQDADKVSRHADEIIAQAAQIIKNIDLAKAMDKHNSVYPELYTKDVRPYIPNFFRVVSMSAEPNDARTCTVTLQGEITSFQQYADLMLALLRIPHVVSVSRTGYTVADPIVPPITPEDRTGHPRKPTDPPIPDDPLKRLEQRINSGGVTGFVAANSFGSMTNDTRHAMPGQSEITVSIVMEKGIQTPDPRATLSSGTGGAAAAAARGTGTGTGTGNTTATSASSAMGNPGSGTKGAN